jgi:transcriptional regulator with XRE-family HTH domain
MTKRQEFGKYIKASRMAVGLTLQGASTSLGYKSMGTINNIEQGLTPVPVEKLLPLIRLYGLDPGAFLARLQECEPELFARYMALKKQFEDEFMANLRTAIIGGRSDQANSREASHHAAFGLFDDDVIKRSLPYLYIMSTNLHAEIPAVEAPETQLEIPFYPQNLTLWEVAGRA